VPFAAWGLDERRAGERGTDAAPREAEGIPLQGRRVVVADDDPAVVWFLSGLLKAVGAEVLEAHDGERALELTYERWPDLVVSDVLMPKLDGFSLCHEIKRDVAVRDVPVILLSWKEDLLQRVRELGADADGYLRKEAKARRWSALTASSPFPTIAAVSATLRSATTRRSTTSRCSGERRVRSASTRGAWARPSPSLPTRSCRP